MPATSGATPEARQSPYTNSPYTHAKASKLPEYLYQAATLLAVLLLLWTVA